MSGARIALACFEFLARRPPPSQPVGRGASGGSQEVVVQPSWQMAFFHFRRTLGTGHSGRYKNMETLLGVLSF